MGRPRKHPPRYYRATDTGVAVQDGIPWHFKKGELLPEGDAKLAACRSYFEPTTSLPPEEKVGDER